MNDMAETRTSITVKDVARVCGLSASTVGYILSANPAYKFKEETRRLVISTAERLDYRSNPIASSFRKQGNNIIIGVAGNVFRHADLRMTIELKHALQRYGYNLVMQYLIDMSNEDRHKFLKQIYRWGAGLAIIDLGVEAKDIEPFVDLLRSAPPTIGLFRDYEGSGINYIRVNWGESFHLVAEYFKAKGCKSVGCCILSEEKQLLYKRFEQNMLAADLIPVDCSASHPLGPCNYYAGGREIARRLLKRDALPDALYSISDELTFTLIEELRRTGMNVPVAIKLISGGDSEFLRWYDPPIPALTHDPAELARVATDDLVRRIEGKEQVSGQGNCVAVIKQRIL